MRVPTLVFALVVLAAPSPAASQQTSNPPQKAQEHELDATWKERLRSEFLTPEERQALMLDIPELRDAALEHFGVTKERLFLMSEEDRVNWYRKAVSLLAAGAVATKKRCASIEEFLYINAVESTGNLPHVNITTWSREGLEQASQAAFACIARESLPYVRGASHNFPLVLYNLQAQLRIPYVAGLERQNAQLRYALAVQTAALRGGQQYASPNVDLQGIEQALRNVDSTLQWMESQRQTERYLQDSEERVDSYWRQQTQQWQGFDLDSSQRREEERRRRLLDDVKQQLRDQQLVDDLLRRLWLLSPDY